MNFGKLVKQRRAEEKLTQQQLADKAGISKTTVSRVENNIRGGDRDTFTKLCEALGIPSGIGSEAWAQISKSDDDDEGLYITDPYEMNLVASFRDAPDFGKPVVSETLEALIRSMQSVDFSLYRTDQSGGFIPSDQSAEESLKQDEIHHILVTGTSDGKEKG